MPQFLNFITWIQILTSPIIQLFNCELLNLSNIQFPHLWNEVTKNIFPVRITGEVKLDNAGKALKIVVYM
jgi:hypothetical protein